MIKIIIFFVLTGMMYSQGLTGHYSSILKKRPAGASLPTENLIWLVDDDSLSSGAVTVWNDVIGDEDLDQGTAGNRPSKTDSGVVFDGGDWLQENVHDLDVTASFSMVIVAKIDSTGSGLLLGVKGDGEQAMTMGFRSNYFVGQYGSANTNMYTTPLHNNFVCIIVTRSVANGLRVYYDGTLQTQATSGYETGMDNAFIVMGASDNGGGWIVTDGTIIRLGAFYSEELPQSKIDDIMASDEITGKID